MSQEPQPPSASLSPVAREIRRLAKLTWGHAKPVEIIGQDASVRELLERIAKFAKFDEAVLISGESGSGKENLAKALYLLGPRRGFPFVSVNCPQYQDGNLTVSELFGHKKGSFTGAVTDRQGVFETSHRGVVFLDEIGDLHMTAQVMLLRALAENEFRPLGSNETRTVDLRVVAATNRPLERLTVANEFRDDLYFRLRYFHLHVPPLRERGDDWHLLLEYYLGHLHAKYGVRKHFSKESLDLLAQHRWPGNVRELRSIVTMGYSLSDGEAIEPQHFLSQLRSEPKGEKRAKISRLYLRLTEGGEDFWEVVHKPFMDRDLNREQVREVIRLGLLHSRNSYRGLMEIFRLPAKDYQKFMDFLRHQRLKPDKPPFQQAPMPDALPDVVHPKT